MPPHNIQNRNSLKLHEMEDEALRGNLSHQELLPGQENVVVVVAGGGGGGEGDHESSSTPRPSPKITKRQMATVVILCYVNLINYMDRFTVAGV